MRKLFIYPALILFYCVAFVLVMEGGVRLLRAAPPAEAPGFFWETNDPITGWRLVPKAEGRWFNSLLEYDTQVKVNSRGLRTPEEYTYEKPSGVYRVLVLGDSFVEAAQVELEESFPQQLSRLFNEHGLAAQLFNVGVSGWGNDQGLFWLREEGYKYQPDLVIIAIYPRNDMMNNYQPLESANMGKNLKPYFRLEKGVLVQELFPFDPEAAPRVEHERKVVHSDPLPPGPLTATGQRLRQLSALYRYVDPRIRLAAPRLAQLLARSGLIEPGDETKVAAQDEAYYPLAYDIYATQPTPEWQAAFALSEAIYAEIKRLAGSMGATTAAVLIPAPEQVIPGYWDKILSEYPSMQGRSWALELPFETVVTRLNKVGIPVLDTLAFLRQRHAAGDEIYFYHDGHWAREGHALTARQLFNFLSSTGLIPQLNGATVTVAQTSFQRLAWDALVWLIMLTLAASLGWSIYQNGLRPWLRNLGVSLGTVGELLGYTVRRGHFVLLPVLLFLLLFGGLLVVAQASPLGPFIYTLF